jgi:hypothetical protein
MALKHRVADASYWVYDHMRHKAAFDSAAQPGTAHDFAGLRDQKYALLVTHDPRARVFPCDPRGKPLGPGVEATARILGGDEECEHAEAALNDRYGRRRRIYDRLMIEQYGMVYLELTPAA